MDGWMDEDREEITDTERGKNEEEGEKEEEKKEKGMQKN